jgi:hypothetical protein
VGVMCDQGDARRRELAARALIAEIHETLLSNRDKIEASPNYGRIVYRRDRANRLDIRFSTKLDRQDS